MSGLEKIIGQIEAEARASADAILAEAGQKAAGILAESEKECQRIEKESEEQCRQAGEDLMRKSSSASQMQRRRALLSARQELIDEIIREAHASLLALPTQDYFAVLKKLLETHVQSRSGELCLNQRDLDRLPAAFAQEASAVAAQAGGTLVIAKTARRIDGGFVLVYEDIEENCSFEALFAADRERLQDRLHAFLFA